MSRWLLLLCSAVALFAVVKLQPVRSHGALGLGGVCTTDRDCQLGLECSYVSDVMEAQCSAPCSGTAACRERYGAQSVCLGADLCARTCANDADCPAGAACNVYNWCERR